MKNNTGIPDERFREIAEKLMAYVNDNGLYDEVKDDLGLDNNEEWYFGVFPDEMPDDM